jgi:hypothetical protein
MSSALATVVLALADVAPTATTQNNQSKKKKTKWAS